MEEVDILLCDYQQQKNQTHNSQIKLALLFKNVKTVNIVPLLKRKSTPDGRHSVLHIAASNGHSQLLEVLLSRLSQQGRFDLLMSFNPTPLQTAALHGKIESVETVLHLFCPSQQIELLTKQEIQNISVRDLPAVTDKDMADMLQRSLAEAMAAQKTTGPTGNYDRNSLEDLKEKLNSYLSDGKSREDTQFVNSLTSLLGEVKSDSLLGILQSRRRWSRGDTVLHIAARLGHADLICTILSQLSKHQRSELLTGIIPTPMHIAASHNKMKSVQAILRHLTPKEQIEILEMKDHNQKQPIDLTRVVNGDITTVQLLNDSWIEAQKLERLCQNIKMEADSTLQEMIEKHDQATRRHIQESMLEMATHIKGLEEELNGLKNSIADCNQDNRIGRCAHMLSRWRKGSTQTNNLSYGSKADSYTQPGQLDEDRNSNDYRVSAERVSRGSRSAARRSLSLDSSFIEPRLQRQRCICSFLEIRDSNPTDLSEPDERETRVISLGQANGTTTSMSNSASNVLRTQTGRHCRVWDLNGNESSLEDDDRS